MVGWEAIIRTRGYPKDVEKLHYGNKGGLQTRFQSDAKASGGILTLITI